jgi:hypothetical protein
MFPVFPACNHLETALRKLEIDTATPKFFDFLMREIKPYEGGDLAIRPIHVMDKGDKHRLLTPIIHYSALGDIRVEQNGEIFEGFTHATTLPPPAYVGPFERGIHVKDPGRASLAVMFQEGNNRNETRAVDTLRIYSHYILQIVKLFEEFVEP